MRSQTRPARDRNTYRSIVVPGGWLMAEEASPYEDADRRPEAESLVEISRHRMLSASLRTDGSIGCGTSEGY